MKAIIIAGISLFAAATIYGVTDFAADKKSGAMDKLYKEENHTPAPQEKEIPVASGVKEEKTSSAVATATAVKKTAAKKKTKRAPKEEARFIKMEDFSRGRIRPKEVKVERVTEPVVIKEKE